MAEAWFFGIIQGVTEFLPVSSSGHLFLLQKVLAIKIDLLAFFVFLHLATLMAVVIFFRRRLKELLLDKQLLPHVVIITFITAGFGLVLKHFISNFFLQGKWIALCFLANAAVLLVFGRKRADRPASRISWKDSLIVGIMQGVAVLPGVSRSGMTISGFLTRGFKPADAFAMSFVMSLPAILGAAVVEAKDLVHLALPAGTLIAGFACAFFFGFLALRFLEKNIIAGKFSNFGYYSLLIAALSLLA